MIEAHPASSLCPVTALRGYPFGKTDFEDSNLC